MFQDIFTKKFYDNTILDWLIAGGLIIVSIVVAKLVYIMTSRLIKKVLPRTETKFDDIFVDMLEEPLVFALAIIGVWYSLQSLQFNESMNTVIDKAYYILIIFNVAWLLSRLVNAIIERYLVPFAMRTNTKFDDQLLPLLRKSIRVSIWIIAILVALDNAGYNVGAILASLGIGGLAFALAAKDTVANLFGSLVIFLDEPFEIGDRISVNGHDGFVEEVGLRSTQIRTPQGRLINVPNSNITSTSIENISSEPHRKIVLELALANTTSHEQMKQALNIMKNIVEENKNLENNVVTALASFDDYALNINLIYFINKDLNTTESQILETKSNVNMEILRHFNKESIELATEVC